MANQYSYKHFSLILTNVTTERYQTLFRDIREANMNVIRVWGGGTYEDDRKKVFSDSNKKRGLVFPILLFYLFICVLTHYLFAVKFVL